MPDIHINQDYLINKFRPDLYAPGGGGTRTKVHKLYWNNGFLMVIDVWDWEEGGMCYARAFVKEVEVFPLTYYMTKTACIAGMIVVRNTYGPPPNPDWDFPEPNRNLVNGPA